MKPRAVSLKKWTEGEERLGKMAKQKDHGLTSSQMYTKITTSHEKDQDLPEKSLTKDTRKELERDRQEAAT